MIETTKFNGTKIMINADLIETVEETPDTVITLTNGHKYIVLEGKETIRELVIAYRNRCFNPS